MSKISRRDFLKVAGIGAAAVGLTKGAIVLFGSTVAAAGLHDMKG